MSDTFQPGRRLGVIADVTTRDRGFVFIRDEDENEYFAHISGFDESREFETAVAGDPVSFRVSITSKGKRAHTIKPASVTERVEIEEWEETRGNK